MKEYQKLFMDIVMFEQNDVVRTSPGDNDVSDGDFKALPDNGNAFPF